MGVSIEVTGAAPLAERLLELDAAQKQPTGPLFESISAEWVTAFQSHFRDQGDSSGRWASLSPATQKRRVKAGHPAAAPILERTGNLLSSIQTLDATENVLSVGTRNKSAVLLHFGGMTAPGSQLANRPVPARPFISLSAELIEDTMGVVAEWFMPEPGAPSVGPGGPLG